MNDNLKFDAVIIGGGAAGMMCAAAAKAKNPSSAIAVLEKNDRLGKKLMSTGNGRCNLTNLSVSPEHYTGSFKKQSAALLNRFGGREIVGIFKSLGLISYFDNDGRCYPISRHAASVLDVLRFRLDALGCDVFCKTNVKSIRRTSGGFEISAVSDNTDKLFSARKLVIACGSPAAPKLGGCGSAKTFLEALGHRFVDFTPALCPLRVNESKIKSVKGLRAAGTAELIGRGGNVLKKERGEIQFTEDSLSGICIFNLSLYARTGDKISLDLLPDIPYRELREDLSHRRRLFSDLKNEDLLTGMFRKRIAGLIIKSAGISSNGSCSNLGGKELESLARTIKNLVFTVSGKEDFSRAQSAPGGVFGSEIDELTMQSKKVKNLFVCGEAVDICGECGGYNLHFAFASGITAGENL